MARPTCTAYRWPEEDWVAWLLVFPSGQLVTDSAADIVAANKAISALARSSGCPFTVIYPKHPNDVDKEVAHA